MSKHAIRRLRKEMRRMDDRQRRDMIRLRDEVIHAVMLSVPEPAEHTVPTFRYYTIGSGDRTVTS
jgi:nucleoside-diphosphate-sugar epimerase